MNKKPPTPAQLQIAVDEFNKAFPVGTMVEVHFPLRGVIMSHQVKSEAYIMGGHSAVAFFDGISGCYDIGCVKGKTQ